MRLSTIYAIFKINFYIYFKKIFFPKKTIIPYKVLFNLTDLCNSRCKFCDIWRIKPKNEITLDHIKNSLIGLENDIYWISFSGGEITLVNYFYELVDFLEKNFKNLKILAFTTNALAPLKALAYAKYCKEKGFDTLITISLDGDRQTHDNIRGIKGNYDKCVTLKKKLDKEKILNNFGITVSESNTNLILNYFDKFIKNIKAITFVHSQGIYNKDNSLNSDDQILRALEKIYKHYKIHKIYEIIEKIHIKISILFLKSKRKKNIIPCDVLNTSIHIMPNGDLKPCMFMNKVGNIKNKNIKDILKNKETFEAKVIIKKNECPKCWMNCYSPHSIMQSPIKSFFKIFNF
jgi:MoaA/NifB/PqqE/SkfB family radical SAM enzyme